MRKMILYVFYGVLLAVGGLSIVEGSVGFRELTSQESAVLNTALKELCVVDEAQCVAIRGRQVKYLAFDKLWFAQRIDRLFSQYSGVTHFVSDGYTITLNPINFDAPVPLRVIIYHEQQHVLYSDHYLYAQGAPEDSWEQCQDHNMVRGNTQKTFVRYAEVAKSSHAEAMKEYSLTSYGNEARDCSNKVKIDGLP